MNMTILDWSVLVVLLVGVVGIAAYTQRYTKSVADFLVSGRCAGRYLLTISAGMVWIDAINIIAMFELFYLSGFPSMGWALMIQPPLTMIMAVTGWAVYRYRETRAMTVPQYLEMRYSRGVRVLAGVVAWTAGMINFGIYPAVSAHFVNYFCGLPPQFAMAGMTVQTLPVVMVVMMAVTWMFVFSGGHITVLTMDFFQGLFINVAAVLLVLTLGFTWLNWADIVEVLKLAPANASLLDPTHTSNVKDFNIWYFVIASIGMFYTRLSNFQGQAFDAAARTPHEGRMGNVLATLRWHTLCLFFMVVVLAAQLALHHPKHASLAQTINATLDVLAQQHGSAVRGQMTVSTALAFILPAGWRGLFLAVMVAAMLSSKSAFIHSFGSVFVQDVVMPFRKKPLTHKQHIAVLRAAILGVTIFAVAFSWLYRQTESILMYFALSNTLWLAGSGAVLAGGLYWRRGTTQGAYASMLLGATLGMSGFALMQGWPQWFGHPFVLHVGGHEFVLNPQWWYFLTISGCIVAYVAVSLITGHGRAFDLKKLLHRDTVGQSGEHPAPAEAISLWKRLCGITPEFTRGDRITMYFVFGWIWMWFAACLFMIVRALTGAVSADQWAIFWKVYLFALFGLLLITTVWLGVGGMRDLRMMFRLLRGEKLDEADDGTVPQTKKGE